MKVCIAYPALNGKASPMLTQNRQFQWMSIGSYIYPLVPAYAATLLAEDGNNVLWHDGIAEQRTYEDFLRELESEKVDIVAFETKTPVVKYHWNIIDDIKERIPEIKTVLYGDHVTALPEETLLRSKTDFVLTGGDYDFSLRGLVRWLRDSSDSPPGGAWWRDDRGEIRSSGPFRLDSDLNSLPFIDRDLTKAHHYYEKWKKREPFRYTMVARDCQWGRCTFCSWTTTYNNFRTQKHTKLLDEVGHLIENYGVKEVFDDSGNFPTGKWTYDFCRGMIERGYSDEILFTCNMKFDLLVKHPDLIDLMVEAGFRKVKSGLESASQATLDMLDKNIKVEDIVEGCKMASRAGLDVQLTIMVGYPWETKSDAQRTVDLARELFDQGYAEMLQATVVIPYPGTPIYEMAQANGWFRFDPAEYERFDMTEPVLTTPDMTPDEVQNMSAQIYKNFLSPRFVVRNIKKIRSWEDISYLARGAVAVGGHIADFWKVRK
ncbi:MAG: B12-binding domain-containing radical SAM protein [Gemmatimonadetes bacterium]|nr:B12-binding domain-containing radical SAM protein [Gemmatimonadota bacterium]